MKTYFRNDVQGLRAIAVIGVLLFHFTPKILPGGFLGVDIFFVISGYIIYSSISRDINLKTFSLRNFWERRIRRLLPMVTVVVLLTLLCSLLWYPAYFIEKISESVIFSQLFISNIYFWKTTDYFAKEASEIPLIHLWSLGVEEQFYLFFPLLALFLHKKIGLFIFLLILFGSFVSMGVLNSNSPVATFYLLPTRAWELLIGVFVAYLHQKDNFLHNPFRSSFNIIYDVAILFSFLIIISSMVFLSKDFTQPSIWTCIPVIAAAFLLSNKNYNFTYKLLSSKVLVFYGGISYSLYLWHQPVITFFRYYYEINLFSILLLFFILTLLAFFSKKYVEDIFRNPKLVKRKQFWLIMIFLLLFSILFAVFIKVTDGMKNFRSDIDIILSNAVEVGHGRKNCWKKLSKNLKFEDACIWGDVNKKPSFVIIGDSHGASLISGLNKIGRENKVSGLDLTLGSCPPFISGKLNTRDKNQNNCDKLREKFFNSLTQNDLPKNVILVARFPVYFNGTFPFNDTKKVEWIIPGNAPTYEKLQSMVKETIVAITNSGRNAIIVFPTPELKFNVPEILFKKDKLGQLTKNTGSISRDEYLERVSLSENLFNGLVDNKQTYLIRTDNFFCSIPDNKCYSHLNGTPLFYDSHHISQHSARKIAKKIILDLNYN